MTSRRLFAIAALAVAGAAVTASIVTCWVLTRFSARVPLRDQSMRAVMPPDLPVRVEVLNAQGVDGAGDAQGVPVRLNETLRLQADFDAQVPLSMTVRYRGAIPVKAQVPLKTEIRTRVLGVPMTLPVDGTLPLDLELPVDLSIPVRQQVRLKFSAPVSARIDQVVRIPLRAQLDTRIRFTDAAIPILVREANLQIPLSELSLTGPALLGSGTWTWGPEAEPAPASP